MNKIETLKVFHSIKYVTYVDLLVICRSTDLQAFWIAQLSDAPTLAERALNILTSFSTTVLICVKKDFQL